MTSTLWFWIVLLILLLILGWLIKRYLGRFLLICLFLLVLFFVYKWIFPTGAAKLLNWIQTVPVQATNYVNRTILKNTIQLGTQDISSVGEKNGENFAIPKGKSSFPAEQREENLPWFKRIFQKKTPSNSGGQLSSGNLEKGLSQDGLLSGTEENQFVSGGVIMTGDVVDETLLGTGEAGKIENPALNIGELGQEESEEDAEIYYLPSNPKSVVSEMVGKTQSSSSLSAEDLREAREIFGD